MCELRRRDHGQQSAYGKGVTRGRLASKGQACSSQSGEDRALPQEMKQRQNESAQDVRSKPVGEGVHRMVLSYSSSIRRRASISFLELRWPASAWSISSLAEPSKTRCS